MHLYHNNIRKKNQPRAHPMEKKSENIFISWKHALICIVLVEPVHTVCIYLMNKNRNYDEIGDILTDHLLYNSSVFLQNLFLALRQLIRINTYKISMNIIKQRFLPVP